MDTFLKPFIDLIAADIEPDGHMLQLLADNAKPVVFAKGALLLTAGEVCRDIYFMVDGKAISYFTDYSGKTTTWFFHYNVSGAPVKHLFAVDYRSFLSGTPSRMSIQALSDITAIKFSGEAVDHLLNQSHAFGTWLRKLHERSLVIAYDRIACLLTFSATERYQEFLKNESYLLDMFSNYLIATYLNITPQSLSRIRKGLAGSTM
ncbi:cAMP-binding protein [Dyadobacter beijingensis]|uniref:cAMP-binding protein n=1 Tax=Dyadobacter beijingensis TaxID=365489 RepID=A0ABQ2ID02_9BACT|nr:Crp/Fnr family transcriptional regulator [Dyadobacter beijingensis]GGN07468.1 cAMP-binding protein [Dyadobacter beijingensis]